MAGDEHLVECGDGRTRCAFEIGDPHFRVYHDDEFGRPDADPRYLFEKMSLEILASGLRFAMALRMRPALREAFHGFEAGRVASMVDAEIDRLMRNDRIVRNERKLRAIVANAGRIAEMEEDLGVWLWGFAPKAGDLPMHRSFEDVADTDSTPESAAMAKALKARGFTFVGPTVCYGIMQGSGMVNDHIDGCYRREECRAVREAFDPGATPPP